MPCVFILLEFVDVVFDTIAIVQYHKLVQQADESANKPEFVEFSYWVHVWCMLYSWLDWTVILISFTCNYKSVI